MHSFSEKNGPMATTHSLASRKVLLPFEIQLCNQLGISREEYFDFLAQAASMQIKPKGYEYIPDVRCEPTTIAIIQIVIGLALTAASALLSQKPQQKKPEAVNVQKEDNIGVQQFTPSTDFGSVQELAKLGKTVPLVFAKRQDDYGGCRANALLTYSCLSSERDSQRIKAIAVTSVAPLADRPGHSGLALGDQLLDDYNEYRYRVFYDFEGGQIRESNSYEQGKLKVNLDGPIARMFWHPDNEHVRTFCGTRTPTSKTEFGLYAPMPNGNSWKLDFQMFILPDAADGEESNRVRKMRQKIQTDFPLLAACTDVDDDGVQYEIENNNDLQLFEGYYEETEGVTPEDIRNQVNQQRAFADDNLHEGQLYAFNNRVAVCTGRPNNNFIPGQGSNSKYEFEWIEGEGDRNTASVRERSPKDTKPHWEEDSAQIMRFQDAIVANNQTCDCTEIGIGSTVWKRITGANINNFPGEDVITEMENNDAGGSYDLGRMDVYLPRYSMFTLQIKPDGRGQWESAGAVFAVKGRRPVEQFNALRIYHRRGQHEFRLRPVPTKQTYEYNVKNGKPVFLLESRKGLDSEYANTDWFLHKAGFEIYFEGRQLIFSDANARNPECYKGSRRSGGSRITGFSVSSYFPDNATTWETLPTNDNPRFIGEPNKDDPNKTFCIRREERKTNSQQWAYFWMGDKVAGASATISNPLVGRDRILFGNNNDRYRPVGQRFKIQQTDTKTVWWYEIEREQKTKAEREPAGRAREVDTRTISGRGSGLSVTLQEYTDGSYSWFLDDPGRNYSDGDTVEIPIAGDNIRFDVIVEERDDIERDNPDWWENGDMYPLHAVTDYRNHDSESCSNVDGPEHRITYVNEIINSPDDVQRGTYDSLASMALVLDSSRDLNNLTQLSAYYTRGIKGKRFNRNGLIDGEEGPINTFPEIAYFLLTNRVTGAGAVIDENQIDLESFGRATAFCKANDFYWDGVISERVNLRDWLFEQASYCLLDFTMKGGRFGFEPAVPVNDEFVILLEEKAVPQIAGLFTDGNIKDMKVTTLPPEDRKMFEAEVLFRKEDPFHFPETRTTNVRVDGYTTQAVETYDLTQFCTSRKQTINFAKYALLLRKHVDHTIEFQTTPESMAGIEPASYIRVVSHACHPSRFENGSVTADGGVVSSRPIANGTQVYYWRPGFTLNPDTQSYIRTGSFRYNGDGKAADFLRGCVFSAVTETSTDRVYKVDSISIGEEGFIQVTATHMPITDDGALMIMQEWTSDAGFIINDTED